MEISRRKFMTATSAAVIVGGLKATGRVWGANERINICVIGFNGRGKEHIAKWLELKDSHNVDLMALCDVDERVLKAGVRVVEKRRGSAPKTYVDMREVMADEEINAISIATPNHWHTLAGVWGCQAGKDVYIEKPASHSVWEGKQLAAAAKAHNRIVQHGTQFRSDPALMRDIKLMHNGFIGKIVHSRGVVYKNGNRQSIGKGVEGAPPAELNYELWQGPAKEVPYQVREGGKGGLWIPYNWHWFWEWGNGESGNQGVHEMDIAVWGHNRGLPVKAMSQGGRYGWDDAGETPNTQATSFTYPDGSLVTFEVRNLGSFHEADGGACSNSFFGTDGYYVRRQGFFDYNNKPIKVDEPLPKDVDHFTRFVELVRSRDNAANPADADVAHHSCAHCHIGNIAYRLGRAVEFDPRRRPSATIPRRTPC
jgi:predicted dehydrogenase